MSWQSHRLLPVYTNILDCTSKHRVRKSIRTHVGDLDVGAVACGIGRAIGNKVSFFSMLTCIVNHNIHFD